MKNKKTVQILAILLIPQWICIQWIFKFPELVENYYSKGIYPLISRFFRATLGWIPFSVGDIFYGILIFIIAKSLIKAFKNRKVHFVKAIAFFSVLYFCFHFFWGFNYFRQPLSKTLAINKLEYSEEDLRLFSNQLITKINKIHFSITKNDTLKVDIPLEKKEVYNKVANGYEKLSLIHPEFTYKTQSTKNSLISLPLTYMGFSGYLNPFSGEAQVNMLNPIVSYPTTSCHEVAHQLGYAAENEANFIGFLAAISNEDIYFQYSGYYMALRYTLGDLYRYDKEKYKLTLKSINKGILKNMQESKTHWDGYKNPLEPVFKQIFNEYLKSNKQNDGIKSYSRIVGMLVNYNFQDNNLLGLSIKKKGIN